MRLRLTLNYSEGRISFERRCRLEARALLPSSLPVSLLLSLLLTDTVSQPRGIREAKLCPDF